MGRWAIVRAAAARPIASGLVAIGLGLVTAQGDTGPENDPAAAAFVPTPDFAEPAAAGATPRPTLRPQLAGPIVPTVQARTGALSGRIVFTSAGHGWTCATNGVWYTQRAETQEMIEDYGNLDQMTLFAFYCFNAGATVVPFRPIGFQTNEVVLDNTAAGVAFAGAWSDSTSTVYYGRDGAVPYRYASLAPTETATATYTPRIPAAGFYPVYTWVRAGSDRTSQLYRIRHAGGESTVRIPHHLVGSGWVYLGSYAFNAGTDPAHGSVVISNLQPDPTVGTVVIADALRFGNGMGDLRPVAGAPVSGYPREEEAARYWVQAGLGQGQPTSLYDTALDDGSDNVGTPPRTAREMNRESAGRTTQRLYLGFHSNAGGGRGCIGLYNNEALFPGTGTTNQLRWAQLVGTEVNNDLSALTVPPLEVAWNNRGANITYARTDYAFGEIRGDALGYEMDASIIEVAFHDDVSDARLMRDPKVRNAVARAGYQAVVRYMNQFDGAPLQFIPEPPRHVRATGDPQGGVTVTWDTPASGGGTPTGYLVYPSVDGVGFASPLQVDGSTNMSLRLTGVPSTGTLYLRVTAYNAGGESLPSPVVGCRPPSAATARPLLFVYGFDRFDRTLCVRQTVGPGVGGVNGGGATFDRVQPARMNAFDAVVAHGRALEFCEAPFDTAPNEAVSGGPVTLTNYPAVLWALGEESSADETFSSAEQARVSDYLTRGGALFVTGSEIAWDLDREVGPSEGDRGFLNGMLRVDLGGNTNDNAGTFRFAPAGALFAGNSSGDFSEAAGAPYLVEYPDVLTPVGSGAQTALAYVGGPGGAAAVQYDGSAGGGRVVFFGFPFEAIGSPEVRHQYLADVLRFLQVLPPPRLRVETLAGSLGISWTTVPTQRYQLQSRDRLDAGPWQAVGEALTATTRELAVPIPADQETRFYRVQLLD